MAGVLNHFCCQLEMRRPEHYFIVLDRIAIPCGQDFVEALDMLFKSHYVFNVEYAAPLHNLYISYNIL